MFQSVRDKDLRDIFDAMFEKKVKASEVVIKQVCCSWEGRGGEGTSDAAVFRGMRATISTSSIRANLMCL